MKVTVSIDSFKGSLSTFQAGKAVEEGIKRVYMSRVLMAMFYVFIVSVVNNVSNIYA